MNVKNAIQLQDILLYLRNNAGYARDELELPLELDFSNPLYEHFT